MFVATLRVGAEIDDDLPGFRELLRERPDLAPQSHPALRLGIRTGVDDENITNPAKQGRIRRPARELSYITNSDAGASETAPWFNVSPDAFNATVFYERDTWDVRVSGAFRKNYIRQFPISTGTCEVGTTTLNGGPCNAPIFADFIGVEDNLQVDMQAGLKIGKIVKLTFEALNLTNETTDRWIYGDNHLSQAQISTGRVYSLGVRATF